MADYGCESVLPEPQVVRSIAMVRQRTIDHPTQVVSLHVSIMRHFFSEIGCMI